MLALLHLHDDEGFIETHTDKLPFAVPGHNHNTFFMSVIVDLDALLVGFEL